MNEPTPAHLHDFHDRPWFGMVYLFFVYLPLFFMPVVPDRAIVASLVATALFVPIYLVFFSARLRHHRRTRVALLLCTAALGYALVPFNPGGNAFVIYAMVMAASILDARRTVLLSLAMVGLLAWQFWTVMPNLVYAVGSVAVVAVIGTMAAAGVLYARERSRRQVELMLTQDEVRRLAGMAERERIGRDLHDLLGHTLSVVALKSELAGKLIQRDPAAARVQIGEVEEVARQALAQVREAVAGIRAAGLQAELAAARLALLSADVSFDQRLPAVELPEKVEAALAMALREAVTNVIRHAGARRVEVELVEAADEWQLSISDDGRGGIGHHGNGLTGMDERLRALGGSVEIGSTPGAGTRVLLRVPRAGYAAQTEKQVAAGAGP